MSEYTNNKMKPIDEDLQRYKDQDDKKTGCCGGGFFGKKGNKNKKK